MIWPFKWYDHASIEGDVSYNMTVGDVSYNMTVGDVSYDMKMNLW